MNAYRNYNLNTSAVSKNLEKLSSGYKINRAGDDAAGLAISEKMRAQITGLDAASKNVKDGISLVKTAEGAMQEVQDMLNRMVSLATQSANGTYQDAVDRENLQAEVDQLRSEINRIADSANFNGIKLLDGSLDTGTNVVSLKDASDVATAKAGIATGMSFTIAADGQMVDKEPTAGKYSVDFSQTKLVNTSNTAITVTFTLTADKTVTFSVAAGQEMNGEDIATKIKEVLMGEHTPAVTTDDVDSDVGATIMNTGSNSKFTFDVEGDKLIIQEVKPAAKQSDIDGLVFNANFTGLATNANGGNVGVSLVTGNNGNQFQVTPEVEPVSNASRAYGMATFSLTADFVKDGAALKLGDTTYVFAVGKNSKYKDFDNVIDLTDIIPGSTTAGQLSQSQLNTAAQRLAKAAVGNKQFIVGSTVGGAVNPVISLTEKEGGIDYNVNNLAGKDGLASVNGATAAGDAAKTDWKGLIKIGTAQMNNSSKGTALTLQIGDTSDSFNQLKVSIGDIHTKALNIDGISIASQAAATDAVNTIKDAINQVSSIRGTLGATQNRLEHTQNNLGVMKENIQDAESTIRDTDVAEEMMAYTKNNILVQSAQAMLAQANQIPQGVLQLLG
jgi:flagellin